MRWVPSLRGVLVASHVLVFVLPIVVLLVSGAVRRDLTETRQTEVQRHAELLALLFDGRIDAGVEPASHELAAALATAHEQTKAGIRIIDPQGTVIFSTGPNLGADFRDRPEVKTALGGEVATRLTRGAPIPDTPDHEGRRPLNWLFVGVPLRATDGEVAGALLLSRRTREDTRWLREVLARTPPGVLVAVLLTLLAGLGSGQLVARAVGRLADASNRVRAGADPEEALARARVAPLREVRELARDVDAMARRLTAQARFNRDFASHAAHEFKTPLSTLRGTVAMLAEDPTMPEAQRQRFLDNAATDLSRLQAMVDGLLALARVEEQQVRHTIALGPFLAEIGQRHPEVTVIDDAPGAIEGDPRQLERAIENLIDNAFEHGAPPVQLRGWTDGRTVHLCVKDAGDGIGAADRQRVFERFYTTSADRRGTGLGLAIVAAVAAAHGGEVHIAEDGRAVTLHLPLHGEPPRAADAAKG